MRRLAIAVIAGTLGLGLVVSAATWRARDDQRAAAAAIGHPPATRPSPTPRPSPTTPRPKVGTWQRLPAAPIEAPYVRESVWTGTEMLVFGRVMSFLPGGDFDVAAAYDPATHTWRKLPAGPDREGSFEGGNQAVWTGSEMLVWGITNKAFNPTTGRWRLLSDPPLSWGGPAVTVWTGRQMIGWGGGCCDDSTADGEAYNPATDSWETLPKAPL